MHGKKRCRVCHCWVRADPRIGARQHTCGLAKCQRERHRLACSAWHRREQAATQEHRVEVGLRGALEAAAAEAAAAASSRSARTPPAPGPENVKSGSHAQVAWAALRDEMGAKTCAVLRICFAVQRDEMRDEMRRSLQVKSWTTTPVPPRSMRDEIGARNRSG